MSRHLRPLITFGLLCCWTLGPAELALTQRAGIEIEPGGLSQRGGLEIEPSGLSQRGGLEIEPSGLSQRGGLEIEPSGLSQRGGLDIEPNGSDSALLPEHPTAGLRFAQSR